MEHDNSEMNLLQFTGDYTDEAVGYGAHKNEN